MIRLAARAAVALVANAVALIVAALVLDDMSLDVAGFVIAVAIFTVTAVVIEPLIRQIALKNVPAILGSTALVATLVSLALTKLLTPGLSIRGVVTWVLATVIVWIVAMVARILLPMVVFTQVLSEASDRSR